MFVVNGDGRPGSTMWKLGISCTVIMEDVWSLTVKISQGSSPHQSLAKAAEKKHPVDSDIHKHSKLDWWCLHNTSCPIITKVYRNKGRDGHSAMSSRNKNTVFQLGYSHLCHLTQAGFSSCCVITVRLVAIEIELPTRFVVTRTLAGYLITAAVSHIQRIPCTKRRSVSSC